MTVTITHPTGLTASSAADKRYFVARVRSVYRENGVILTQLRRELVIEKRTNDFGLAMDAYFALGGLEPIIWDSVLGQVAVRTDVPAGA